MSQQTELNLIRLDGLFTRGQTLINSFTTELDMPKAAETVQELLDTLKGHYKHVFVSTPDTSNRYCGFCGQYIGTHWHWSTTEQESEFKKANSIQVEQGTPYWWCSECKVEIGSDNVTFDEFHDSCGASVVWKQPISGGAK